MASPLSALVSIIANGVQTLESTYAKRGTQFPSLDGKYQPGVVANEDPALIETTHLIVAAAAQLIMSVRPPEDTIRDMAGSMYISSTLGFAVDTNVPDILNEAGPQGLHAKDLAPKIGTDPNHLSRILRYLATRHVFREVTPNVFTNNRISSALIKSGKTLAELEKNPMNRYDDSGSAAIVGHICDEGLKSSVAMSDFVKDPKGHAAPFNMALNTKLKIWDWFEQPGNEWRLRRFFALMTHDGKILFKNSVFTDAIDWKALKKDSVIVDVGGNLGTVTLTLSQSFPHLRYIVQDLSKVIPGAEAFWKEHDPKAIAEGRVKLQVHSFFEPQPVKGAAVYFTRFVLHDWSDAENIKILKHIRAAASRSSKLVLFEFCVPYACPDPENPPSIGGSTSVPYPLLANLGVGGAGYYTFVDIQMMSLFDGQERTLGGFKALGEATGWKLDLVKIGKPATFIFSAA